MWEKCKDYFTLMESCIMWENEKAIRDLIKIPLFTAD